MKKSILLLAVGFTASTAFAQKVKVADVPAAVKESFAKNYPKAEAEGWEKENGNYEVEAEYNETEMSVLIDPSGNILETEVEIKVSELPKGVTDYLSKNLTGQKTKEASKITDAKGTVTYEAEVGKTDYIFDSNGNFIKKEMD